MVNFMLCVFYHSLKKQSGFKTQLTVNMSIYFWTPSPIPMICMSILSQYHTLLNIVAL